MSRDQRWFLADERLLELEHLRHMIGVGPEFFCPYAFVDARQIFNIEIFAVVNR
jgi:hypothetical protein